MALTGHYPFDNNGNDLSGNGNNLTANGTPTYVYGVKDFAAVLNGSSQYFTAAANTVHDFTTGDFSFSFWLYRVTDSGGIEQLVIKFSAGNVGYRVFINASDKIQAQIGDASGATSITGDTSIATATWYFVTVTFDRDGNGIIYLNATSDGSASISGRALTITNAQTFTVGRDSASSAEFFPGRIDDLRIYNTALTSTEVATLYNKAMIMIGKNDSATVYTCNNFENLTTDATTPAEVFSDIVADSDDAILIKMAGPTKQISFDWVMTTESSSVVAGTGGTVDDAVEQYLYLYDTLLSQGTDQITDDYVITIYFGAGKSLVRTGTISKITTSMQGSEATIFRGHIDFQVGTIT